ncbi:MAG: hypothetical protein A4S14_05085 [Proteobacteria bacterium SG_bin9]|nr:MAG: hypothetical protein A4S14_05085 [Proteobacteria bacterium SG_bin9]
MSTVGAGAAPLPFTVAGFSLQSWGFAIRIWIAAVVALLVSFWLQLQAPSTAIITVMILAEPTRGQALQKAGYRLIATALGVAASIAIVGLLSQTRDLMLLAFAAWMGLCVYACGLLDGYRAYAAVLSGYTVALIAIQQIDNPLHVFDAAMDRGAAIAVGALSITLVNDLLFAPDRHPQIGVQLAALHRRVWSYAQSVIRGEVVDVMAVAALIRDTVALRPDITSLAAESSSGSVRSAAARSAMVALISDLHAVRALAGLPEVTGPALREFRRRDAEVRLHLASLNSVTRPLRSWKAPLYSSQRIAIENGVRAVIWIVLAATLLVMAGWPSASFAFGLIGVIIGLGATTPAPRMFTTLGFIGAPIAVALTGILEFSVLNGVSDFPLLAIGLAPFMIGAALFASGQNPVLAGLGKVNLIFISAIFAASNPQTYNPQAYLFTSLFICVAISLLLAMQYLIPPVSEGRRRRWLLVSARRELDLLRVRADRRYAPEEATFRDAVRVGQIVAGPRDAEYRASVEEALTCFDQAAAIRLSATHKHRGRS